MSNEVQSLEQQRREAIEGEQAFGVTRLKDEFKMKPKKGAVPHAWIKSPYNRSRNPVYLVSDCVPLRSKTKTPPTEKQILARKISGLKFKLRSKAHVMSSYIAALISSRPASDLVYLDCETTGLGNRDQIIELAIIDQSGSELFHSRIKPTVNIHPDAENKHGISMEMLRSEPLWTDVVVTVRNVLKGKLVVAFNADFDLGMLASTCHAHELENDWVHELAYECAMKAAVAIFGSTNRYGSISLADACCCAGVEWQGTAHSAWADTKATQELFNRLSEYSDQLRKDLAALELQKQAL